MVGTIYEGAFWRDISQRLREQKRNRFWVWLYLIWHMAGWPFNLAGLLSDKRWYAAWARHMAWLLRGFTEEQAQQLFYWVCEERVIPHLRSDIMEILRNHQSKGHLVALISGSPQRLLDTLASRLEIEHTIGTLLEVKEGRYTGNLAGPLTMNEGKVVALDLFAGENGFDIDWENSFAYGDSRSDIPLLDAVGKPVAVYPDEVLRVRADERGWKIIGQREPRT